MIKLKHESELLFKLRCAGAAATSTYSDNLIAPFAGYIRAIYAKFATAGVGGSPTASTNDLQIDINKNGASIFSSDAAAIVITAPTGAAGATGQPTYHAPSIDPVPVAKGDVLSVEVGQILNGDSPTQPIDLIVYIVLQRGTQSPPAGTLLGKIDSND